DEPEALAAALRRAAPAVGANTGPAPGDTSAVLAVLGILVAVLGVAAFAIYAGLQPPSVSITADAFRVSNGPYSNTIPLRRITAASLDNSIPHVRGKTNGFAAGEILRGSFRMETWGSARLYINTNRPPFVVIRTDD